MGCCGDDETGDDKEEGPNLPSERWCTDILCCITFIIYWLGMLLVAGVAFKWGDPDSVNFGKDLGGFRCGVNGLGAPNASTPKVYYPRLSKDLYLQADLVKEPWRLNLYGICVEECPKKGDLVKDPGCMPKYAGLYPDVSQKACGELRGSWTVPLDTVSVANRCLPMNEKTASRTTLCAMPKCSEFPRGTKTCYTEEYADEEFWVMDPYSPKDVGDCVTQVQIGTELVYSAAGAGPMEKKLADGMQGLNQVVISVRESRVAILLFGILAPMVLAFCFMFFMQWLAGPAIYLAILVLFLVMLGATFLCACQAGLLGDFLAQALDKSPNSTIAELLGEAQVAIKESGYQDGLAYVGADEVNEQVYKVATLVLVVLDVLYMFAVCFFSNNIAIAVEVVEVGSHVVGHQPSMLLYPFTTVAAVLVLSVYFVFAGAYIGTLDASAIDDALGNFSEYNVTEDLQEVAADYGAEAEFNYSVDDNNIFAIKKVLGVYHLLGFLWSANFIIAISTTTIAGAVSYWFFYRDAPEKRPSWPLLTSQYTVVRFHLGTMAFGSLVIALVQLLRIIMEYVDQQTKEMQEQSGVLKLVMCCVRCCLACFERCIKFITSYAYIYTALNGDGFCTACFATWSLFVSHGSQVLMNAFIQQLLRVIQCVAIPITCAIACYYDSEYVDDNSNPLIPAGFALVFAYVVCRVFSSVYETVIDTLFVCTMRDVEKYDARHTPPELAEKLGFDVDKSQSGKRRGAGGSTSASRHDAEEQQEE